MRRYTKWYIRHGGYKDAHYHLYLVLLVLRDQCYYYSKCYLQNILIQESCDNTSSSTS
jgi:hypothetical protein